MIYRHKRRDGEIVTIEQIPETQEDVAYLRATYPHLGAFCSVVTAIPPRPLHEKMADRTTYSGGTHVWDARTPQCALPLAIPAAKGDGHADQ